MLSTVARIRPRPRTQAPAPAPTRTAPERIPAPAGTLVGEHLEGFCDHLRERRLSPATVWNYGTRLRIFAEWLHAQRVDFTRTSAIDYLRAMQRKTGYRPRTIRVTLTAMRALGDYLRAQGIEPPDLANIKTPQLDQPQRVSPTDEQVRRLFAGVQRLPRRTDMQRYRRGLALAVLGVVSFCGLRAAELLALDVSDYDAQEARLRVRYGKGGDSRWVPVNDQCAAFLAEWLEIRNLVLEKRGKSDPALFLNSKYQRLGELGLRHLWDEILDHADLAGSGIVRHSMRHWCVSAVAESQGLMAAQAMAGHRSVQTTYEYLHSQPEKVRSAAQQLAQVLSAPKERQPDPRRPAAPQRRRRTTR